MKKRMLFVVFSLALVFVLAGCSLNDALDELQNTHEGEQREVEYASYAHCVYDYIDSETGVHYLLYSFYNANGETGGITPRLNPDGSVMVDEAEGGDSRE